MADQFTLRTYFPAMSLDMAAAIISFTLLKVLLALCRSKRSAWPAFPVRSSMSAALTIGAPSEAAELIVRTRIAAINIGADAVGDDAALGRLLGLLAGHGTRLVVRRTEERSAACPDCA